MGRPRNPFWAVPGNERVKAWSRVRILSGSRKADGGGERKLARRGKTTAAKNQNVTRP